MRTPDPECELSRETRRVFANLMAIDLVGSGCPLDDDARCVSTLIAARYRAATVRDLLDDALSIARAIRDGVVVPIGGAR